MTTSAQQNAYEFLRRTFAQYGLDSLSDKIMEFIQQGYDQDTVALLLRDTQQYKDRFPAMEEMSRKGIAFREIDYVNYERKAATLESQFGLPAGMLTNKNTVKTLLVGDVDADDLERRVQMNAVAAQGAPPELKAALKDYYGLEEGAITAFYLDPKNALSLLERQSAAAKAGQFAREQKVALDRAAAEDLAGRDLSADALRSGFREVKMLEGLNMDQGVVRRAAFGDAEAQTAVTRQQSANKAQFEGAGGAASEQAGVVGLRKSTTK